jgi:putative acyl-CoA dehydrogenase
MALAFGSEVHSLAWTAAEPGAHFARGVLCYGLEPDRAGRRLPDRHDLRAAYPGLASPEFAAWREKILSPRYDKRPLPFARRPAPALATP